MNKQTSDGIIKSGSSGALDPNSKAAQEHADRFYEEVRHRTTDVKRIADNTMFKEKAVEEIKQHLFFKEHDLGDGEVGRFAADFEQAQAWDRLTHGKHTELDLLLLKHEYVELTQMRLHGYNYPTAHNIANKYHNWASKLKEVGK